MPCAPHPPADPGFRAPVAHASPRLTTQQQQAMECGTDKAGSVTRVVAGAGVGKTRVLVERVRHLVELRGKVPERLLVVAFNRNAAQEIEARPGLPAGVKVSKSAQRQAGLAE